MNRVYEKSSVMLRTGDRVCSLLRIESGIVLVYNEARSRVVNVLAQGDYLGDVEFCLGVEFNLEAIALTKVVEVAREVQRQEREIICQSFNSYNNLIRILNQNGLNAKQKAIAGLIWFIEKAKLPAINDQVNKIPINDYILSDITGMARETCTRAISPLVRGGIVKRNNGKSLSILQFQRLLDLS